MLFQPTFLFVAVLVRVSSPAIPPAEEVPNFWRTEARQQLQTAIDNAPIVNKAKNVVLFLGDGMGVSTVTAARILAGQMNGQSGEEGFLSFEKFPFVALSKTYNIDAQTPDSAGTGTAYLCGVKTRKGVIGVDGSVVRGQCAGTSGHEVTSILRWSADAGKSTGVVTTTRITHATPAASYAHSANRDWEGDVSIPVAQRACKDIAYQLVMNNSDINVIMGGGREYFLLRTATDPEVGSNAAFGRRDIDLIEEWKRDKVQKGASHRYVWNLTDFNSVDAANTDYLLGLFNPSHMQYEIDRAQDRGGEPSLAEMTRKAIQILQKNPQGFFLLVEGGQIDLAHHENRASRSLHDAVAFAEAIEVASNMLDMQDSLIVVTADHSHTFTINGYSDRGSDIFGLVTEDGEVSVARDQKPYTTLLYGNGPGFSINGLSGRTDPSTRDTTASNYVQESAVPLVSSAHGGEDVAIYARGPMAHLFHGVHEQSFIPHVMAFASCVGDYTHDSLCSDSLHFSGTWPTLNVIG